MNLIKETINIIWKGCYSMSWLDKLERKFGRIAIPNLMLLIVGGMFTVFVIDLLIPQAQIGYWISFDRSLILQGQIWRLISFIFTPVSSSVIWILFSLYFYYLIGDALETQWGSFRFNVYYFIGVLGAVIAGMITGYGENSYLNLSLFFAFAMLYPNYEVLLFFILPVKIKYLAFIDACFFVISLVMGSLSVKAAILFSILNFLIFFGGDFFKKLKYQKGYRTNQKNFRDYMNRNGRF